MTRRRSSRTLSTGERILQALELIVTDRPDLSVKELAQRLGVSLSTAYHLVHTLAAAGYVVVEPHRCIRPGPALYRLLERLPGATARPETFEPLVDEVGQRTGCRAYLAAWSDRDVEVLYVHGRRGVRELPGLGRGFRGAAHALALGKVLLAERDPEEWPAYLQAEQLPRLTPHTLGHRRELQRELAGVRSYRVAFDREEYALGATCIAVPLAVERTAGTTVALGISVPTRRFALEAEVLAGFLREVAQRSRSILSGSDFGT
ncbi:MAG: IclR family transcriptional regulator C-terminal domain-containing protein [Thermomicrobium sp.]|nr:IclR family transcriptional regulator C-terminal domain-containing protein [Thermomicrobium sp.]